MAVAQITGGDGTSTSAMTTSSGSGFSASGGVFISASYAAASAVSVGSSVGGSTSSACAIWARISGFSTSSTHRLYVGLQTQNDLTANHYYVQLTFTAANSRDYAEIYKFVSSSATILTPQANDFVESNKIYFKRDKLSTSDDIGLLWMDNELHLVMHDADEGDFLPMARVIDSSITTAGYCGLYLGTDSNGTWDDVYTGTFPIKWVSTGASGSGTKASPWNDLQTAVGDMDAGGVLFVRAQTYSSNITDIHGFVKGTNWYNPSIVTGYNTEAVVMNYTGGQPTIEFGRGTIRRLADAYIVWMEMRIDGQDNHMGQPGIMWSRGSSRFRIVNVKSHQHGNGPGVLEAAVGFQDSYSNDTPIETRPDDYDVRLIGCHAYDNRWTHGFYFIRSGIVTEFCHAYDNGENGIQYQPFPASVTSRGLNNKITHCRVYNNGLEPDVGQTAGIYIAYQTGLQCYSNLVYSNVHHGIRVSSFYAQGNGNVDCLIYNNTTYDNGYAGVDTEYTASGGYAKPTGNKLRNNISYGNGGITPKPPGLPDPTNTVRLSSVMQESATNEETNNYLLDPGFTDPDNATLSLADFTLTSKNLGVVNQGLDVSAIVKTDFLGYPHYQGDAMDIGALSWPEAANPPVDPVLNTPTQLDVVKNVTKALTSFSASDFNDPDATPYTLRIVVMAGTLNDGA